MTVEADLVVGCDGRHSTIREKAGLQSDDYGAPMDALWFRVTRRDSDGADVFGHIEAGALLVMLDRGDYWQCAYVIPKGGIDRVKADGIEAFRSRVVALSPFLADRVGELKSFDDIKLLSVMVNRLGNGGDRGSSALATRRTRCRRSAASASISRCRMQLPPPTAWLRP